DVDGAVRAASARVSLYRLVVTKSGAGAGTVGGSGAAIQCGRFCSDRLDAGTVVTLTAAPARGSWFVRWRGACGGSTPGCVIRMFAPATAVAIFGGSKP